MSNANPIRMKFQSNYQEFFLPKSLSDKKLCISIYLSIDAEKWELDKSHILALNGKSFPFSLNKKNDIELLKIKKISELFDMYFDSMFTALRINNGDVDNNLPKAKCIVKFLDEDENEIETFICISEDDNPTQFFVNIKFKSMP